MGNCAVCGLNNPKNAKYCRNCGATLINDPNVQRSAPYPKYGNMKRYICVKVTDHKNVAETIHEYQQKGWMLHTYNTAGGVGAGGLGVYHYLLFEKE